MFGPGRHLGNEPGGGEAIPLVVVRLLFLLFRASQAAIEDLADFVIPFCIFLRRKRFSVERLAPEDIEEEDLGYVASPPPFDVD